MLKMIILVIAVLIFVVALIEFVSGYTKVQKENRKAKQKPLDPETEKGYRESVQVMSEESSLRRIANKYNRVVRYLEDQLPLDVVDDLEKETAPVTKAINLHRDNAAMRMLLRNNETHFENILGILKRTEELPAHSRQTVTEETIPLLRTFWRDVNSLDRKIKQLEQEIDNKKKMDLMNEIKQVGTSNPTTKLDSDFENLAMLSLIEQKNKQGGKKI